MLVTTWGEIRKHNPCYDRFEVLLSTLGNDYPETNLFKSNLF